MWRVGMPATSSGVIAAVMLGIGRVIGETMAGMMITGNAARIPTTLLQPVRTMTATIAAEMGEAVQGSPHYASLFAIGIVLFIITAIVSQITRPIQSITAAITPEEAAGITTRQIACQCVAPSASAPSR